MFVAPSTDPGEYRSADGGDPGPVFESVGTECQIFPSVGLRHPAEAIRVNFGHQPFKYDIDDHVQQARDTIWAAIQREPVRWDRISPADPDRASAPAPVAEGDAERVGREGAGKLVLSYLVHHGYAKTAQAFEAQLARTAARAGVQDEPGPAPLPVPPPPGPAPAGEAADADSPMTDPEPEHEPASAPAPAARDSPLAQRLAVVHAVQAGDIDSALEGAKTRFPDILERQQGIILLKLRCRKFVELVNEAAEMKRRVERATAVAAAPSPAAPVVPSPVDGVDVDGMDVDDTAGAGMGGGTGAGGASAAEKSAAEAALRAAIAYGQALRADYRKDARREVQAHLDRTFGVVAYHFPMEAGGEVGRWAGQAARDALAGEVNQAILGALLPLCELGNGECVC